MALAKTATPSTVSYNCNRCDKPITGDYLVAMGHHWHPEHFLCTACQQAIVEPEFVVENDRPYHPKCALIAFAPECSVCGHPIGGMYLIDGWGRPYCRAHQNRLQECDGCGGYIASLKTGAARQTQIVRFCERCNGLRVDSQSELANLYRDVTNWGERIGLAGISQPTSVQFSNAGEVMEFGPSAGPLHLGITRWTRILERKWLTKKLSARAVDYVSVMRGLPRPLCQTVLAHEMGHVWLCQQGVADISQLIEEGFCEYLAHRFNGAFPTPLGAYFRRCIEGNRDPVYGDGFRKVHALLRKTLPSQFISELRAGRVS